MTGYGKATMENDNFSIELDIKSVNSRFLDFRLHAPRELLYLESILKDKVTKKIQRGKVELRFNMFDKRTPQLCFNDNKFKAIWETIQKIEEYTQGQIQVSLETLIEHFEIIQLKQENPESQDFLNLLMKTLEMAIDQHQAMALNEGKSMKDFLNDAINIMNDAVLKIEQVFPVYKSEITAKIRTVFKDIIGNTRIETDLENRLSTEIAFYIERSDINEEIVRLKNHLRKLYETVNSINGNETGKIMNFILQEMHREINTVGSKFNYSESFNYILSIKTEIEKCREIVQNVE